ncbi:unnamed protein product [Protopolystoma xenopodis]|uniref:USP domain-containing protein n=1 Tax=Protopolystoma xenopodis TaxID=117903 RepID=A0A448X118_9PLAT|nr:unnamed protein product [Protopolystoma xenopodis]
MVSFLSDNEKAELYWKRYLAMDNSAIADLFVGQLMSTLECTECKFKSTTFDPFWDLSLPIPKLTFIQEDNNGFFCYLADTIVPQSNDYSKQTPSKGSKLACLYTQYILRNQ